MTITIPTGELTGLLNDVTPFALPDEDLPELSAVRLEWDGQVLHAFAHDLHRVAWSQWCPDDPPVDPEQQQLGVEWGGADDPWAITIALRDAKEIAAVFKVPNKERECPLGMHYQADGRLKVARSRESSRSALTGIWEDTGLPFDNLRERLSRWDRLKAIRSIAFNAALLADFELVRPRGPLRLTFTGEEKPTLVEIGPRFCGAIMPIRTEPRAPGASLATAEGSRSA